MQVNHVCILLFLDGSYIAGSSGRARMSALVRGDELHLIAFVIDRYLFIPHVPGGEAGPVIVI